jgi:hypothetical protein
MSPDPMFPIEPPRQGTKIKQALHNAWYLKSQDWGRKHYLLVALVIVVSSVGGVVLGHWLFRR